MDQWSASASRKRSISRWRWYDIRNIKIVKCLLKNLKNVLIKLFTKKKKKIKTVFLLF